MTDTPFTAAELTEFLSNKLNKEIQWEFFPAEKHTPDPDHWYATTKDTETRIDALVLSVTLGAGSTPREAAEDYAARIYGKSLVYRSTSPGQRREILVLRPQQPAPGRVALTPGGWNLEPENLDHKRYTDTDRLAVHRYAAARNNAVVRLLEDTAPTAAGYGQGSWNQKTNESLRKYVTEELEKIDA